MSKTTFYVGGNEIILNHNANKTDIKRHIAGKVIVTLTNVNSAGTAASTDTKYLLRDHLGSVISILNGSGSAQEMSFDPWGQRNAPTNWQTLLGNYPSNPAQFTTTTNRGFTGHEMVDTMRLIHMNGRIYDPKLGRFMQADPFVQFAGNTQSYNRYAYVLNNPLIYTDPSGYFSFKDVLKVVAVVVISYFTFNAASYWAMSVYGSGCAVSCSLATANIIGGTVGGAAAGFTAGVSMSAFSGQSFSDSLNNGVKGALSGAVFGGIGGYFGNTWNANRVGANGLAGGITSKANGGEFKDGLKLSLATSLLTLANYKMRQAMVKQSELNPDNIGKDSKGFFGDGKGIAGTRRVPNPEYGEKSQALKYLKCDGPAGGCQGPKLQLNDVGSRLGRFPYKSSDLFDTVSESFAGPHDWLSDKMGMYDAMGNGIYRTGISNMYYETVSYGLIPVAAPFSVAGLIDTTQGAHNILHLERD